MDIEMKIAIWRPEPLTKVLPGILREAIQWNKLVMEQRISYIINAINVFFRTATTGEITLK